MAVVFIAPKQRQKMFFIGITVVFLLFLVVVSFGVFMYKPTEKIPVLVFNKPKVNIDMKVFDLEQFKNLQPFAEMETLYSYTATTIDNRIQTGFISAVSVEAAETDLKNMGLNASDVKIAEIGRDNPFVPYYTPVVAPVVTKK